MESAGWIKFNSAGDPARTKFPLAKTIKRFYRKQPIECNRPDVWHPLDLYSRSVLLPRRYGHREKRWIPSKLSQSTQLSHRVSYFIKLKCHLVSNSFHFEFEVFPIHYYSILHNCYFLCCTCFCLILFFHLVNLPFDVVVALALACAIFCVMRGLRDN